MTINSTTRKAGPFVGNGTVSAFPFGFKVFQASDLFVVRLNVSAAVEQTLVLNSDYSVTLNPDQNSNPGGVVTLSSALASGYTLTLTSDVPDTQPTDLTNQGGFYPEVINDALDRATIQIQQVQEEIDRTLTAPISTPVGTNLEFPLPSANKFIGWNSTATGLQNFDASSLASIVAFATAYADTFNGDGVTSTFALSYPPATVRNLDVSINGVTQVPVVDYNINGRALNFTTPPPRGSVVLAKYWQALPNSSGAAQDFTLTPNGYTTAVDVQKGFNDLGSSAGTSKVGFLQAGTGAQARSAQDKLRDVVSVKDFGAVGNGVTDDTVAMQAAHNTGRTVYYPRGIYNFTTITIPSGGIIGEGKLTILRTTDTGTGGVITYTGVDSSGLLVNTVGGLFKDFTLWANTPTQKASGAGISVVPASGENYLTICDGIYVRNIPTGVRFTRGSYFSVVNSYFAFFTVAGIYSDMDDPLFQDNGDNVISGNAFFTNAVTSPSARAIWYRGGGAKIIGNKINGGMIGVDINPLRGTSVAIVEGNSVENQTLNALRGYIGNDFTPIGAGDGFSFLQFVGNQIGGYNLTGPAISINSYASDPKFYNCMVSDNIVFNPVNYGARAIDIRQVDRFVVSNNLVDNSAVGYGSLFVASSATGGLVTRNQFLRAATSNVLNSSVTTALDQIVSQAAQSEAIGTINAGASYVAGIATTAELGDYASASVEANTNGCIISADVYATNAVRVVIYNPTASPIVVGTANVRVRVTSK